MEIETLWCGLWYQYQIFMLGVSQCTEVTPVAIAVISCVD